MNNDQYTEEELIKRKPTKEERYRERHNAKLTMISENLRLLLGSGMFGDTILESSRNMAEFLNLDNIQKVFKSTLSFIDTEK